MRLHGRSNIAIIDLQMPVMGGSELLRAMAKDELLAKVPVVVAFARPERDAPVAKGRFLRKPIDVDELLALVRKYTG